jgi:hypothetical protein
MCSRVTAANCGIDDVLGHACKGVLVAMYIYYIVAGCSMLLAPSQADAMQRCSACIIIIYCC